MEICWCEAEALQGAPGKKIIDLGPTWFSGHQVSEDQVVYVDTEKQCLHIDQDGIVNVYDMNDPKKPEKGVIANELNATVCDAEILVSEKYVKIFLR